jgi:hypothetical protein
MRTNKLSELCMYIKESKHTGKRPLTGKKPPKYRKIQQIRSGKKQVISSVFQ